MPSFVFRYVVSYTRENTTPESRCTVKKSSCRQSRPGEALSAPRKLGKKRRLSLPDVRDETILHLSRLACRYIILNPGSPSDPLAVSVLPSLPIICP
jgi:hypothetical protein